MSIKTKLHLTALLAALSLIATTFLLDAAIGSITALRQAQLLTHEADIGMLTLRRHEKDFLARQDLKYQQAFEETYHNTVKDLEELSALLAAKGLDGADARATAEVLGRYRDSFNRVVELTRTIGLTHEQGLQGGLRDAVHQAEGQVRELNDHQLLADILMLRRNEKDFILRGQTKYVDEFKKNFRLLEEHLASRAFADEGKVRIGAALGRYQSQFLDYAAAVASRGLTPTEGQLGQLRETVHQSETLLARMMESIEGDVAAEATKVKRNDTLLALALAAVIVAAIAVIGRSVSGRIAGIGQSMNRVRENKDLCLHAAVDGADEVAAMGGDFNTLLDEIALTIREVAGAVARVSSAADELAAITEQTRAGMRSQQSETEGVASAMSQMGATVEEIARSTTAAADAAHEADQESHHGRAVVDAAVTSITRLAEEVQHAGEVMTRLEQQTEGVTTILDVIRGIAEQTNLLALNAAIEAARAGEQGRGFAVVADEVRTLAQRTHQSTQEIQSMIERLQAEAREAATVMGQGRRQGEESVRQVNGARESFEAIARRVAAMNDRNTQIAGASEQQRSVTEEVSRNITRIKAVTDETAGSVSHIAASSHELADIARQLQQTVQRFRTNGKG